MVDLKKRCTVIVTGNGIELDNDQRRRFVPIFLDAKRPDPENRKPAEFKQPNLHGFMADNRGRLVWACLVLVQNWFAKDQPFGSVTMATFEQYCRVMGGILEAAGVEGFLSNLTTFREAKSNDQGDNAASAFMQELYDEAKRGQLLEKGFTGKVADCIAFDGEIVRFDCFGIKNFDPDKEKKLRKWLSAGTTLATYNLIIDGKQQAMRFVSTTKEPGTKLARWKFVPV